MKITLDKKWAYARYPETEVMVGIMQDGYVVSRPGGGTLRLHDGGGHCIGGGPSLNLVPLPETVKGWFNVYMGSAYQGPYDTEEEADSLSAANRTACVYMTQTTPPEED